MSYHMLPSDSDFMFISITTNNSSGLAHTAFQLHLK